MVLRSSTKAPLGRLWGYAKEQRGLAAWSDQAKWQKLVTSVMKQDWSWARSAQAYMRFYKEAVKVHSGEPASAPA